MITRKSLHTGTYMPDKYRKRRERLARAAKSEAGTRTPTRKRGRGRVSRRACTLFTSQFATLQDAGMPILRSLRILENQLPEGPIKRVASAMAEDVEGGTSLSEAMAKHPEVFNELYVNMVKAGEAGGALTTILNRQAEYMERQDAIARRIKAALIYPSVVAVVALGILIFIMVYVVPKFEHAFANMNADLPAMTQSLINFSRNVQQNWFLLILIPVVLWGAYKLVARTPAGRQVIDRTKLRLWLVGPVNRLTQVARFARTLGTLSSSGVPLLQSLEITRNATGNVVMAGAVDRMRAAVREGENLAPPMAETTMFDEIVVNMVDVGEETGELDRMLMKVAQNKEAEAETRIGAAMSALEPAIIVVMGLVVAFIVISLFLPLLSFQEILGR